MGSLEGRITGFIRALSRDGGRAAVRMFIAGMDGYLGWSLAQHLIDRGHQVADADALFPWITEDTRATSWGSSISPGPRGIAVIEDAAHSLSAAVSGQPVGSIADVTAVSFHANKSITTGDGGMLTTADHRLADRGERLRLHGIERDVWRRYQQSAGWRYEVAEAGFKANMTDFQAALGRSQLSRESAMRARRTAITGRYSATFAALGDLVELPVVKDGVRSAWHLYPLRLAGEARTMRDQLAEDLELVGPRSVRRARLSLAVKRGLDVVLCLVLMAAALPVFVTACLAIRVDSPGSVLYRRVRSA